MLSRGKSPIDNLPHHYSHRLLRGHMNQNRAQLCDDSSNKVSFHYSDVEDIGVVVLTLDTVVMKRLQMQTSSEGRSRK